MKIIKTHDGSSTVYNEDFDECYHSLTDGAYTETLNKHILPPLIFTDLFYKPNLKVLDICFGLGYNSFATISHYHNLSYSGKLEIFSPEKDTVIFDKLITFEYPKEIENINIKEMIRDLKNTGQTAPFSNIKLEVFLGDGREYLSRFKPNSIDIIYQDPFSPNKNQELWDEEYFGILFQITSEDAMITTYSTRDSIRNIAKKVGFFAYEYKSNLTRKSTLFTKKANAKLNSLQKID